MKITILILLSFLLLGGPNVQASEPENTRVIITGKITGKHHAYHLDDIIVYCEECDIEVNVDENGDFRIAIPNSYKKDELKLVALSCELRKTIDVDIKSLDKIHVGEIKFKKKCPKRKRVRAKF